MYQPTPRVHSSSKQDFARGHPAVTFVYADKPIVSNVFPRSGPVSGGTVVTVSPGLGPCVNCCCLLLMARALLRVGV